MIVDVKKSSTILKNVITNVITLLAQRTYIISHQT